MPGEQALEKFWSMPSTHHHVLKLWVEIMEPIRDDPPKYNEDSTGGGSVAKL